MAIILDSRVLEKPLERGDMIQLEKIISVAKENGLDTGESGS